MSKRLKNYPDPMLVVSRYGADALRSSLLSSPLLSLALCLSASISTLSLTLYLEYVPL
jgi:isoleucyl-tRNA synthetase